MIRPLIHLRSERFIFIFFLSAWRRYVTDNAALSSATVRLVLFRHWFVPAPHFSFLFS